jgi:hypothetical protein
MDLKKQDEWVWSGFIYLRIRTNAWKLTFGFHKTGNLWTS